MISPMPIVVVENQVLKELICLSRLFFAGSFAVWLHRLISLSVTGFARVYTQKLRFNMFLVLCLCRIREATHASDMLAGG